MDKQHILLFNVEELLHLAQSSFKSMCLNQALAQFVFEELHNVLKTRHKA